MKSVVYIVIGVVLFVVARVVVFDVVHAVRSVADALPK